MDSIDNIIISRLGERRRKIDFIEKNMKTVGRKRFRMKGMAFISAAACLVLLLVVSPFLFNDGDTSEIPLSSPDFSEYRGDSYREIGSMITGREYEKALRSVDDELASLKIEIREMEAAGMDMEEREYTLALYKGAEEELLWGRIYILAKLNRSGELRESCRIYLKDSTFTAHKEEVERLMEKL